MTFMLIYSTQDELDDYDWTHKVEPLEECSYTVDVERNAQTYTAFFKQRHIGNSVTIDNDYVSDQGDSMYKLVRQHPIFIILMVALVNIQTHLKTKILFFPI